MTQEERIAALEKQVQELRKEDQKQETISILTSIGIIILAGAVILGRFMNNRAFIDIEIQISSLSTAVNQIMGIDGQVIRMLQELQELLVRIIDLLQK